MLRYEADAENRGFKYIAGVDEVGRGPLAGPVVAAAVILPLQVKIDGINDSKKLSAAKRELLFFEIMDKAASVGIGMASSGEIDRYNILNATKLAMRRALGELVPQPDFIFIDAVRIKYKDVEISSVIKGDEKIRCVAAASIIAKVVRDELVREYDAFYPGYNFGKHKGYGTKEHISAIYKLGVLPVHRRSFAPVSKIEFI